MITGGGGNDTLTGGGGDDDFIYTTVASGTDTILDFSGVTAFGGGAGDGDELNFIGLLNGTFSYIGGTAFHGAGDSEARFAGPQTLEIDTNGNGAVDLTIKLTGFTTAGQLTNDDFFWS